MRAPAHQFQTLEEYVAAVGFFDARSSGKAADGFKAILVKLDLGDVKVRLGEASRGITMIGAVPDLHVFVLETRPTLPQRLVCGRNLPTGAICYHRPSDLMISTSRSPEPWPWASIWTPFETLERCGIALAGRDVSPSRLDMAIISAPESARQRLLRLVADAGRLATSQQQVTTSIPSSRALSGAVLEALVACLAQGETAADRAATRRRHQIMARLDRVLREQPDETPTLPELCATVGVAERTLSLVCKEFAGLGPMQYSRSLRLSRARQRLLTADPKHDRVSSIAMDHGFWALGRFAVAYRATFGESPSETLARNG